jgi:hypothetical protein
MPCFAPRISRAEVRIFSRSLKSMFRAAACAITALVCASAQGLAKNPSPVVSAPAYEGQSGAIEMEQKLFVQVPDFAGGANSIVLVWLPKPLESVCLGRTMKECSTIDFCIRTTNPDAAMCRNLGIPRAHLSHYPPEMQPHRMISVVLRAPGDSNGFALLKNFYSKAPKDALQRLSTNATIRAKIRYTSNPSDEGFYLMEVISVPPL